MAKYVAIERIQLRVVDVGGQNAFAQVIENHDSRGSAQAPERSFVQFCPYTGAGTEHQQSNRFATRAQRQHEQARASVLAAVGILHHRSRAVVDLALFPRRGFDDGAGLRRSGLVQSANKTPYALIPTAESVAVDQILPDTHRVPATIELPRDQFPERFAVAGRPAT